MNIFSLLTKEKHIAGIEISDSFVRVSFFHNEKNINFFKIIRSQKTTPKNGELVLIEEPIPENIILDGVVINKTILTKILKTIWDKAKLDKSYAVVSIPEDKVYSNILSFPKTVNDSHFEEAVNLAINFQLPLKRNEVYVGWENTGNINNKNEALVSAMPKNIADDYINVLDNADIKTLALESHISSMVRFVKSKSEEIILFTKKNKDSTTVFIVKDGILQFSRTIPTVFVKEEKSLIGEITKIKTSLESKYDKKIKELNLNETEIKEDYEKYLESVKVNNAELQPKWFVSLGAFFRGKIPEGKDDRISLLPVGTAEAYSYQKTATFIALLRNMTIGVSIFFLFAFAGIYLFIFSLAQTANQENSVLNTSPVPPEILQKESWINNVNATTLAVKTILSNTPMWNILLDEINSRVLSGILISNFSVTSINDQMSMIGTAKDRNILNQFKKSLQASTYLTAVDLPINNLEQKGDIPFTISFRLKDPSMLYYK